MIAAGASPMTAALTRAILRCALADVFRDTLVRRNVADFGAGCVGHSTP